MAIVYEGIIATGTDTLVTTVDVPAATPTTSYLLVLFVTLTYGRHTNPTPPLSIYDDAPVDIAMPYWCHPGADDWQGQFLYVPIPFSDLDTVSLLGAKRPLSPVPSGTTVTIVPDPLPINPPPFYWTTIQSSIALFSGVTYNDDKFAGSGPSITQSYDASTGAGTVSITSAGDLDVTCLVTPGSVRNDFAYPRPLVITPPTPTWALPIVASHDSGYLMTQETSLTTTIDVLAPCVTSYGFHIGGGTFGADYSYGAPYDFHPESTSVPAGFSFISPGGAPYCPIPNLHLNRKIKVAS